jgi:coenzyme F390 synthetase
MPYFNQEFETLDRGDLNALIDERVRYTVRYAVEHSAFYRHWFRDQGIDPGRIRDHEDLLGLPVINGETIRENQPPETPDFGFKSASWDKVYTVHETSGTSGPPKAFFLTWDDWERYAEKYARSFVSQGFTPEDRVVMCASYGMNVGANTMTLAARKVGFSVIPEGRCTFPVRVITIYQPTAIIGSVFKLLRLARRLEASGVPPQDSGIERMVIGGESFARESREYLEEVWAADAYNTYGSTEGSMCGECSEQDGLHVPEDLVHVDIYDPSMESFVADGACGRLVLTTLIPVNGHAGNVLINYDTEDTSVVRTRERCKCGRTHMKIEYPQREAETYWLSSTPVNRVDIERGVFQRENLEYINGEYEAFIYGSEDSGEITLRVSVECHDPDTCGRKVILENFLKSFFASKPALENEYIGEGFNIELHFTDPGGLELHKVKGRPKRLIDRR